MDVPHVWGHNSETKAQIKNPKTCGPSKWPPLTKGMPYSWLRNVSFEKPRDNRKTGYRNIILEIIILTQPTKQTFLVRGGLLEKSHQLAFATLSIEHIFRTKSLKTVREDGVKKVVYIHFCL